MVLNRDAGELRIVYSIRGNQINESNRSSNRRRRRTFGASPRDSVFRHAGVDAGFDRTAHQRRPG
jgi:hypothetical protein